jgi:hypothetical protein
MRKFEFEVVLAGDTEMTEELADRLFEAGCDGGLPGMSCGVPCIDFSREADSLEPAIRSAIADLQKAGCVAAEVRLEAEPFVSV